MERIKVIEKYLSPDFMERDEDGYKGLRVSLQCGSGHNDCVSGAFTKPLSVDSEEPLWGLFKQQANDPAVRESAGRLRPSGPTAPSSGILPQAYNLPEVFQLLRVASGFCSWAFPICCTSAWGPVPASSWTCHFYNHKNTLINILIKIFKKYFN